MTRKRPGPIPGTTGRPKAEIAAVCLTAYANGHNMAQAVAAEWGCGLAAARAAVSRARNAGHPIPYDYGFSVDGQWRQHGGIDPRWTAALANANAARARRRAEYPPTPKPRVRTPRAARPFTPPKPTGPPHACADCGHTANTGWELAAHTLDRHGRPLAVAERTPQEQAA